MLNKTIKAAKENIEYVFADKKFIETIGYFVASSNGFHIKKFIINPQAEEIAIGDYEKHYAVIVSEYWPAISANANRSTGLIGGYITFELDNKPKLEIVLAADPYNFSGLKIDYELAKQIILKIAQRTGLQDIYNIKLDIFAC